MSNVNLAEVKLFLDTLRSQDTSIYPGLTSDDSAFPIMTEIFLKGNCGNLAIMLALAFQAQPILLVHDHHIVSLIGDRLFDIRGDVTDFYGTAIRKPLSMAELMQTDMVNNYSYNDRGPII